MRLVRFHHVVKGGEGLEIAGFWPELLAGQGVDAVVKRKFQHLGHVEERGVVPAFGLACHLGLNTADDAVVARVFPGKAAAQERGDNKTVIVVRRHPQADSAHFGRLAVQIGRGVAVHADGDGRLVELGVGGRLQAHER